MNETTIPASARVFSEDGLTPLPLRELFANEAPVEVDVGCGKGRFLLARAKEHPDINYLGIDRMLRRIRKVDRKAVRAGLTNIRLFRMEAYYAISYLIPPETVSAYYVLFPDPWPKKKHHDHRLFNERFIEALHRTLTPGAPVHVATDHLPYFDEIHARLKSATDRFEEIPAWEPAEHERTDFELLFLGRQQIGRASFIKRVG
jgi:tRNA (guanine-N7-)-methyltransferase